jgi:hypothetical protein
VAQEGALAVVQMLQVTTAAHLNWKKKNVKYKENHKS